MADKIVKMKKEIRTISEYRALIISKYFMSVLLSAATLYLGYLRYPISPFFILILLNAMPAILSHAFLYYANKSKHPILDTLTHNKTFQLNNLKLKYRYTKLYYVSNSISYLIALLLLSLWQYNYSIISKLSDFLLIVPVIILFTSLLVRLLGVIYYRIKIPFDLSHNQVK